MTADSEKSGELTLGLLEALEADATCSQRRLADDLGVALGLVNACMKRCIRKGFVKVKEAPARRYAYYLTPRGLSEKSRLTVEYLALSFAFFRRAREDLGATLLEARARGCSRVVLLGLSELTEVALICALQEKIAVVAIVDEQAERKELADIPVVKALSAAPAFDAAIVTDMREATATYRRARSALAEGRVLAPRLLGLTLARSPKGGV